MTENQCPPAPVSESARWLTPDRLAWVLLAMGLAACAVRFLLCFPIWPDEAFYAISLARRDFAGLLEPLDYHQVAPPLFTIIIKLSTVVGGFNEWSLRIVSFVCIVASLLGFRVLARRTLTGWAYPLAVGILAATYSMVRYSAEVKPYSVDILVSILFLLLALAWTDARGRWRYTTALCLLAAAAFSISFPSVFVGAGVVLFMAFTAYRRDWPRLIDAAVVGVCLTAGFVTVYLLHTSQQMTTEIGFMRDYWDRGFPPTNPLRLVMWLADRASGELMPYPIGGKNAGSVLTLICCVVGFATLVKARRWGLLVLLLGPVGVALFAAILQRYPFGAPSRAQLYLAPIFALAAGAGLARLLNWTGTVPARPTRWAVAGGVLAVIALSTIARDVLRPFKTSTDQAHRDLARTIWESDAGAPPALCLREDLQTSFTPDRDEAQTLLTSYLCNFYIYAKPEQRSASDWSAARVVNFQIDGKVDPAVRDQWVDAFADRHGIRLAGSDLIEVPNVDKREQLRTIDVIEVFRFVSDYDRTR